MLSGDNGLLTRTTDAKERTGISEVVENAKLDVLAQIAENKGENISKEQLKTILNKYFENVEDLELPDDLSNTVEKLTAKSEYGGYENIALSEIYNGKLKSLGPGLYNNSGFTPWDDLISNKLINVSESGELQRGTGFDFDFLYGRLIMPDNGVTSIGAGVFAGCSNLTDIKISQSVTNIGNNAFSACSSLTKVNLPDSLITLDGAFNGCTNLSDITIPQNVTSIGYNAFSECTSLKNITIPISVTSIGGNAFSSSALINVTIEGKIANLGYGAFSNCKNLKSLTLGSEDTINGMNSIPIGAFSNSFTSNVVDELEITLKESVTTINIAAFYGCTGVSLISIPGNVTTINSQAFEGWTSEQVINVLDYTSKPEGYANGWSGNATVIWKNN